MPGLALPWSERSTLKLELGTKMLKEKTREYVMSPRITLVNLPTIVGVILFSADVPSARAAGFDRHNLCSVYRVGLGLGTLVEIEVPLVVSVLKSPAVAGVLSLPLRGKVRGILLVRRGSKPSGCRSSAR